MRSMLTIETQEQTVKYVGGYCPEGNCLGG